MWINCFGQQAAITIAVVALLLIPVFHPLLTPVAGVASHLLWWVHVLPVSLIAYRFGQRAGGAMLLFSAGMLVAGERFFGGGSYGQAADWETIWSLAIALLVTNSLMATVAAYAGKSAKSLNKIAYSHTLTGLPNRRAIEEGVRECHRHARHPGALLFIDVDDFDTVNYSFGHDCGDAVLHEIADRFSHGLPADALLGHWAGDKFAVYLAIDDWLRINTLIGTISRLLETPICINGFELRTLSAGIGVAIINPGEAINHLFQNADTALSQAKKTGRSGRCIFEGPMKEKAAARLTLLNDLHSAISENQLTVYYQPIHEVKSAKITGVEALVRWRHPDKGFISPGEFIPVAEQTGLIGRIGELVLNQAFDDFARWKKSGLCDENFKLNVNVSPAQLSERNFVYQLNKLCRRFAIVPSSIVLEITETVMMTTGQDNLETLRNLAAMCFNIAIDDFGSGYSSLNYLHKLPVNVLKIDREIINQSADREFPLVRPIAEIAKAFNFSVIAEGVESATQLNCLKAAGVESLQGFHLSRPMPASELVSLLRPAHTLAEIA